MTLCNSVVSKTFMNLEVFLQKAASLDIFEALIFNYKVKMGLLDPLAIHFLSIVTDLANQLQLLSQETSERKDFMQTMQISELSVRKSDSQDSVVLSIKSEELEVEGDPLVFSLYSNCSNMPEKNSKLAKDPTKNVSCPKLKQKTLKTSYVKKSESQSKLDKKNVNSNGSTPLTKEIKSFKCNLCQSDFQSEAKLAVHKSKCQKDMCLTKGKSRSSKTYKCTFCSSVYATRRILAFHLNQVHKSESDLVAEEISNDVYTVSEDSVTEFNEEIQLLPENLPFLCCKTCLVVYKTHKDFESHTCKNGTTTMEEGTILHNYIEMTGRHLITNMDKLKALKKYKCGLCHEEYRSIHRMSYHLPRCTQGPYKCELCNEEYTFKKDLNLHKKKAHKGTNSFFCDECGLAFKFRTSLQKHKVNRHETDQGPYSCEECGKNFNKRINLTNHKISTHRIERKFLCQVCGNKFSNYGSLMAHLETHSETRKFNCSYCNKKFRLKEKLKFHTRIHTGERPHLCQTCGKGFIRKSKLDEHIRRHRGEKRYHCSICNKSYAAAWDLKLHNRKQHPQSAEATSSTAVAQSSKTQTESVSNNGKGFTGEEGKTEGSKSVQKKNSEKSNMTSEKSKTLKVNANSQQQENQIMPSSTVNSENPDLLMHLNSTPQSASLIQESNLENSGSRILLQLEHTPVQNQPVLLNSGTSTNNSKIVVQLDSSQQSQPSAQTSPSNNPNDSNSNRILVQLDPVQAQNSQTLVQNGNAATSSSRVLLHLGHGQSQSLPPNTVLTLTDTIHLAPLVEDVNSINLGNVTAQYIQLTSTQPDDSVPSNGSVINGNNVPLHIQLPVSSVQLPLSTLSHGSGSGAFELKSLSIQGQTGLVFASTGFDVGSITY